MMWLRWILLLAGALFMLALFLWERRRGRRLSVVDDERFGAATDPAIERTDTQLPSIHIEPSARREPSVPDTGAMPAPLDRLPVMEVSAGTAIDIPILDPAGARLMPSMTAQPPMTSAALAVPEGEEQPSDRNGYSVDTGSYVIGHAVDVEPPSVTPKSVRVEWPPEAERSILSVRLVCRGGDRLSGRNVRHGLEASGFLHGRFGIFHQPGPDGRAVLSAANLSRPGLLDPDTMDFVSFSGLSLFAVLPGPQAPGETLELLLSVAQSLADRLGARLQNEHGAPLDQAAIGTMESQVAALNGATIPGEGESAR